MNQQLTPAAKLIQLTDALTSAGIPFAVGGAIARNYYAEPRLTQDIDIGLFVPPAECAEVLVVLARLVPQLDVESVSRLIQRDDQVRIPWETTPLDLFFAFDEFHAASKVRVRIVESSSGKEIPILSAEDIIVHKLLFNRAKDWQDIADILYTQRSQIDIVYIRHWLTHFFPIDEPRVKGEQPLVDIRIRRFEDLVTALRLT